MLPLTNYVFYTAAAVGSVGAILWASRLIQFRCLPDVDGPETVVVRSIIALSLITAESYLLGVIGAFSRTPLTIAFVGTGIAANALLARPPVKAVARRIPPLLVAIPAALGIVLLFAIWLVPTIEAVRGGMRGTDALWYHMPFALQFYQSHSLTGFAWNEPLFQTYFYPSLGSMFHALGMAFFDRDFLSPLVNIGWLALLVAAGAALGKRRGVTVAAALGVTVPFAGNLITELPLAGSATVDVGATFLFLASVVLLLRSQDSRSAIALSGLAAGLGVATKLTIAIPAIGIAIGLLLIQSRGRRLSGLVIWGVAALGTSWLWFGRNLAETGSPLPMFRLPFLPGPGPAMESRNMRSLARYLNDPHVVLHVIPTAWVHNLGPLAIPMFAAAAVASLALLAGSSETAWRAGGLVALIALGGYFFTPGTGAGPIGGPLRGVSWDTRFIAPGLCLGLALIPISLSERLGKRREWLALPMALLLLVPIAVSNSWSRSAALCASSVVIAAVGLAIVLNARRLSGALTARPRGVRFALIGAACITLLVGGRIYESAHLAGRDSLYNQSAAGIPPTKIGVIGIAGTFNQYLASDAGLQNQVQFIGVRGPNGSFRTAGTCWTLRSLINSGGYRYVIAAPNRNIWKRLTTPNRQVAWISGAGHVKLVKRIPGLKYNGQSNGTYAPARFLVYKVAGKLSLRSCPH